MQGDDIYNQILFVAYSFARFLRTRKNVRSCCILLSAPSTDFSLIDSHPITNRNILTERNLLW